MKKRKTIRSLNIRFYKMKQILLSLIVFNSITIYAQVTTTFEVVIVDSGKHEFKQQAKKDTPDYSKAYRILTNQVKLNPKNEHQNFQPNRIRKNDK